MAKPVETDRENGAVSVLLAHIIATGSQSSVITDSDMDYPKDWKTAGFRESKVGHRESSRTVAIHSLAVVPRLQGCGLGKLILKAYLQQINNSGIADRVVLICEDVSFTSLAFCKCDAISTDKVCLISTLLHTTSDLGSSISAQANANSEVVAGMIW